jgi:hypothetical protein
VSGADWRVLCREGDRQPTALADERLGDEPLALTAGLLPASSDALRSCWQAPAATALTGAFELSGRNRLRFDFERLDSCQVPALATISLL